MEKVLEDIEGSCLFLTCLNVSQVFVHLRIGLLGVPTIVNRPIFINSSSAVFIIEPDFY